MFVYIGGVPGVGKTTIIKETLGFAQKDNLAIEYADGISIMCDLAGVKTVDNLRIISEKTRSELRPKMEEKMRDVDTLNPKVIRLQDGHFVFFDFNGLEYGTRQIQYWDKEHILGFVVIVAHPELILQRRLLNIVKRPDRRCDIDFIVREQKMEISVAVSQASVIGIPCCFIRNNNFEITKASNMLFKFCIQRGVNT